MPNATTVAPDGATIRIRYTGTPPSHEMMAAAVAHHMNIKKTAPFLSSSSTDPYGDPADHPNTPQTYQTVQSLFPGAFAPPPAPSRRVPPAPRIVRRPPAPVPVKSMSHAPMPVTAHPSSVAAHPLFVSHTPVNTAPPSTILHPSFASHTPGTAPHPTPVPSSPPAYATPLAALKNGLHTVGNNLASFGDLIGAGASYLAGGKDGTIERYYSRVHQRYIDDFNARQGGAVRAKQLAQRRHDAALAQGQQIVHALNRHLFPHGTTPGTFLDALHSTLTDVPQSTVDGVPQLIQGSVDGANRLNKAGGDLYESANGIRPVMTGRPNGSRRHFARALTQEVKAQTPGFVKDIAHGIQHGTVIKSLKQTLKNEGNAFVQNPVPGLIMTVGALEGIRGLSTHGFSAAGELLERSERAAQTGDFAKAKRYRTLASALNEASTRVGKGAYHTTGQAAADFVASVKSKAGETALSALPTDFQARLSALQRRRPLARGAKPAARPVRPPAPSDRATHNPATHNPATHNPATSILTPAEKGTAETGNLAGGDLLGRDDLDIGSALRQTTPAPKLQSAVPDAATYSLAASLIDPSQREAMGLLPLSRQNGIDNARVFGDNNKFFTREAANAAGQRILRRLGGVHNIVDPAALLPHFKDLGIYAGHLIEGGIKEWEPWKTAMVEKFTDAVQPHLKTLYDAATAKLNTLDVKAVQKSRPRTKPGQAVNPYDPSQINFRTRGLVQPGDDRKITPDDLLGFTNASKARGDAGLVQAGVWDRAHAGPSYIGIHPDALTLFDAQGVIKPDGGFRYPFTEGRAGKVGAASVSRPMASTINNLADKTGGTLAVVAGDHGMSRGPWNFHRAYTAEVTENLKRGLLKKSDLDSAVRYFAAKIEDASAKDGKNGLMKGHRPQTWEEYLKIAPSLTVEARTNFYKELGEPYIASQIGTPSTPDVLAGYNVYHDIPTGHVIGLHHIEPGQGPGRSAAEMADDIPDQHSYKFPSKGYGHGEFKQSFPAHLLFHDALLENALKTGKVYNGSVASSNYWLTKGGAHISDVTPATVKIINDWIANPWDVEAQSKAEARALQTDRKLEHRDYGQASGQLPSDPDALLRQIKMARDTSGRRMADYVNEFDKMSQTLIRRTKRGTDAP